MNCFIEIKKSELKSTLKVMNVRHKYQDKICELIKKCIESNLQETIECSIEEYKYKNNMVSLSKWIEPEGAPE